MLWLEVTFAVPDAFALRALHSIACRLFSSFLALASRRISNLQPLFPTMVQWGFPKHWHISPASRQLLCCLLHRCKACVFMPFRTLLCNGELISPMFSVACALF